MYTDWFKLRRLPFRLRPDPDFLYLDDATGQAYTALHAAATRGQGVVCLIGEVGVGKTTLLHALARERADSMTIARIQQPNLTATELAATLLEQFGLTIRDASPADPGARLRQFVAGERERGRTVLVLVDEAQRCSTPTLRELLRLGELQPAPLLVLAGEPTLSTALAPLLADNAGASVTTLAVARLDAAHLPGYLRHRLTVAGSDGRMVFEPDTLAEIMRYTGGTPALINTLCDGALMLAASHNMPRVGLVEIRGTVQELNWVEFSARPAAPAEPAPAPPEVVTRSNVPQLEVRHRDQHLARVALVPGRLIVGRAVDAGLRLDNRFVSRHHCQFVTTGGQTVVEDLGSRNGILVNGTARREARLAPNDQVVIGEHTLTYLEAPAAEPA
jgi:general secretion pathway protein A